MQVNDQDDMIMPPSPAVTFSYSSRPICSVPVFVLVLLACEAGATESSDYINALKLAPDKIADGDSHLTQADSLAFLQETISWEALGSHLSCPTYLREPIGDLWRHKTLSEGPLTISFSLIGLPNIIYRYITFREDRASQLLKEGGLFLPCPAMFNDPFDCSLDEETRLTFIEAAIGCFSTVPNDVLMFSHYADNHKGFAVGFDTRLLVSSLTSNNSPLRSDLRPVWYFPVMPKLSLHTEPALCATCKSDIWSYENEFRIFMAKESALAPSKLFSFDRNAIVEVILGCRASDDTVAACKSFTDDLENCKRKKAFQSPSNFGVKLHDIHRT